jgi:UPF0716 protein FxsA
MASLFFGEISMRLGLIWLMVLLVIEIWSIVSMSNYVGGWATLVLLVAGFIFGLKLMRSQGINAMMKTAQGVQLGESPLAPLATGIVKAFAGILLIIPGFVSDFFALLILLPFVRNGFARHLAKKGQFQGFANGSFGQSGFGGFGAGGFGKHGFGGFGGTKAANEGNVYEHDGSAKPNEKPSENVIEGQVIEHKFDK